CTKMFSLKDCDAIGFDMDHTLCRYVLPTQIELGHQAVAKWLVEVQKYPKNLIDPVIMHPDMIYSGGLLFDAKHGTLVKMDETGKVEKASFGTKLLTKSEIVDFYSSKMSCDHYQKILDGVLSDKGVYHLHDNNFDMTLTVLLSRIMELVGNKKYDVFGDFYKAIAHAWDAASFSGGNSMFFEEIKTYPEKYLLKCPEVLKTWLKALKNEGKVLFLLTSSHCDFAKHVMDYCFGSDWRDYFDIVVSKAKKPRFFNEEFPFKMVDPVNLCELDSEVINLHHKGWYSEGNSTLLFEHFKTWTKKDNPTVVYFGDSVKSDIVSAKAKCSWETVYIMDALRVETASLNPLSSNEQHLLLSDAFGPILSCSNGTNSFFRKLIETYGTIAVPSVEYVASLPIEFQYSRLGNGKGYYPKLPDKLI
uniref:5'-nucleotidase domain-containing protein 1 n=1 Tax=Ciona savignyi TaxID=51511 RepID=H2YXH5_CIOSA